MLVDLVEDAVDEFAGFKIAIFLGQLNRLINRDFGRDIRGVLQLIHPHAENIAINDRHALDLPIGGIFRDLVVNGLQIRINTIHDHAGKQLNVPPPKKDSLWTEAFLAAYKPRQEMFSLAGRLRKSGCKTAILSNTDMPVVQIINKQKDDSFDVTVLSCLEGMAKPGREIYDFTVNRLG